MLRTVIAFIALGLLTVPVLAADPEFEMLPLPPREDIRMILLPSVDEEGEPVPAEKEPPTIPNPDIVRVEMLRQAFDCTSPEDQSERQVSDQKLDFNTTDAFLCPYKGDDTNLWAVEAEVSILNLHHHTRESEDEPPVACKPRSILNSDDKEEFFEQVCWAGDKGYVLQFRLIYLSIEVET